MKKWIVITSSLFCGFGALAQQTPTGDLSKVKIAINGGDKFTNDHNMYVDISFPKDVFLTQMIVSENSNLQGGSWVQFIPRPNHSFSPQEGVKTIYIQFKDKFGRETNILSDEIFLDKTPPTNPVVKIDTENGYTNNLEAKVDLSFSAEGSPMYMRVSNNKSFYGVKWRTFIDEIKGWKLEGNDDGDKYVFAQFRDAAGNESAVVSDKVTLDRIAPLGGELAVTNLSDQSTRYFTQKDRNVHLKHGVRDAAKMKISEKQDFSDMAEWMSFQEHSNFEVSNGDGDKAIFAKYMDLAGNESSIYKTVLYLDITPPTDGSLIINSGHKETNNADRKVTLTIAATDAKLMMISNEPDFKNARWQAYSTTVINWQLTPEEGKKMIFVKFKDAAGNESDIFQSEIVYKKQL